MRPIYAILALFAIALVASPSATADDFSYCLEGTGTSDPPLWVNWDSCREYIDVTGYFVERCVNTPTQCVN